MKSVYRRILIINIVEKFKIEFTKKTSVHNIIPSTILDRFIFIVKSDFEYMYIQQLHFRNHK